MERYFFNLHECGTVSRDDEGVEHVDLSAARSVAIQAARDIMSAEVKEGRLCLNCYIQITDHERSPLLTIPFRDVLHLSGVRPD